MKNAVKSLLRGASKCRFTLVRLLFCYSVHTVEEAGGMQSPTAYAMPNQPCKILRSDCVFQGAFISTEEPLVYFLSFLNSTSSLFAPSQQWNPGNTLKQSTIIILLHTQLIFSVFFFSYIFLFAALEVSLGSVLTGELLLVFWVFRLWGKWVDMGYPVGFSGTSWTLALKISPWPLWCYKAWHLASHKPGPSKTSRPVAGP